MKHMERFKKVLNIALKNEWLKKNPFANFRPSYKIVHICYRIFKISTIESIDNQIERPIKRAKRGVNFLLEEGRLYKHFV